METLWPTCGRCKRGGLTSLQHSFSGAPSATTRSENTDKHSDFGKVLTVALELKKLGYSEAYLTTMVRALKKIGSVVGLDNPSLVLLYVAKLKVMDSYKANLCDFYKHYCSFYGLPFIKPRYRRDHKIPNVPTEEKINLIIGHASKKYAIIYNIMKECGLRPVEVGMLKLRDVNLENGTISVFSAKYGEPRIAKLKPNTHAMLLEYVKSKGFDPDDELFPPSSIISNTFERLRTSIAKKLKDPELKKIRLYDLRHYYATMLYHKTRDLVLTKERLGHRNIKNTMIYVHLVNFKDSDEFYSATAKNIQEAQKLVESGFEYVATFDNLMLFRKRK